MRKQLFQAIGLAASAQLSLWALDVLVNLGLVKKVFRPHQLLGTPADFVGLFLVNLQIALLAVGIAWMFGSVLVRVLRSGDAALERLALVTAILVGLTVTAGSTMAWGGLTGLLGWVGLRFAFKHLSPVSLGVGGATPRARGRLFSAGAAVGRPGSCRATLR